MQASSSRHPLTFQFQQRRPGDDWLPDPVTDTTAKRRRGAKRLFGDGEGVICRLLVTPDRHMYHAVVVLPGDIDLYLDSSTLARAELELLFGPAPRYVKVARGRAGRHHVHALVMLPERHGLPPAGSHGPLYLRRVKDDRHLRSLAEYFSRPSDERACRSKPGHPPRYSLEELREQLLDAAELYLTARRAAQGQRLPRRSWTSNLPKLNSPRRIESGAPRRLSSWCSGTSASPLHAHGGSVRCAVTPVRHRTDSPPRVLTSAPFCPGAAVRARAPPPHWQEGLRTTTAPSCFPVAVFRPGARPSTSSPDKATAGADMR